MNQFVVINSVLAKNVLPCGMPRQWLSSGACAITRQQADTIGIFGRPPTKAEADEISHAYADTEETIGTEDRVYRDAQGWHWQARGTRDARGPFETREAAVSDYESC